MVVLGGITFAVIYGASYHETHAIIPLEEDEGEIVAKGNYYHDIVGRIDMFQDTYTDNRKLLLELADDEMNEDASYISNVRIFVYEDGTYQERISNFYNDENTDSFILGNIDVEPIKEYLHQNEEVFKGIYKLDEKYREEEEAIGKSFIAHYGNTIAIVDELRYQKAMYSVYLLCDKDVVQNYDVTNVE
ncbi:MAG: hypothetical protein MJ246_05890 [Clostridia bacterium]|nr:hypothetical protein [Clostridia bacterium]